MSIFSQYVSKPILNKNDDTTMDTMSMIINISDKLWEHEPDKSIFHNDITDLRHYILNDIYDAVSMGFETLDFFIEPAENSETYEEFMNNCYNKKRNLQLEPIKQLLKEKYLIHQPDDVIERLRQITWNTDCMDLWTKLIEYFNNVNDLLNAEVKTSAAIGYELTAVDPSLYDNMDEYEDGDNFERSLGIEEAEKHPEKYYELKSEHYLILQ